MFVFVVGIPSFSPVSFVLPILLSIHFLPSSPTIKVPPFLCRFLHLLALGVKSLVLPNTSRIPSEDSLVLRTLQFSPSVSAHIYIHPRLLFFRSPMLTYFFSSFSKLGGQVLVLDVSGTWHELTGVLNKLAANLTSQVTDHSLPPSFAPHLTYPLFLSF